MEDETAQSLQALLGSLDTVMLTTISEQYRLVSRPMAVRVQDFSGTLRFFAPRNAPLVAHITARATVNVSFCSAEKSLSLTGIAHISTDPRCIDEHWHNGLTSWFPAGAGDAALIEFTTHEVRFWAAPNAVSESRWKVD